MSREQQGKTPMNARHAFALAASALALAGVAFAAPAQAAPTVRLDHVIGKVIVIPEARATITAEVRNSGKGGLAKPTLTVNGDELTVNGGLSRGDLSSCSVKRRGGGVNLGFFHHIAEEDLPVITLRVPMDVILESNGAIDGEVGATHSLNMIDRACGDWRIGAVADKLEYELEGKGDVFVASANSANLRLQGLGDFHLGSTNALDVGLQGLGDVTVDQVNGPVHASLQGMGDLRIKGGHATEFTASLQGMGDIRFDGVADTVNASAQGMGDIHVAKATGEVHQSRSGFAEIHVGR
jgi:hypothetical protein